MVNAVLLALGIALLVMGGEILIRGALAAAVRLRVSPLLSGLLIVGFGTSAPELVVSTEAAVSGQPDLAVGNIVGSNVANILLILGVCALISPMLVKPLVLRRDAIAVVAATMLCLLLATDHALGRPDAAILLTAFAAYLIWAYWTERFGSAPSADLHKAQGEEVTLLPKTFVWIILAVLSGLVLLIGGAQVLLKGAVGMAEHFSVPEAVIGLTLVAVGTSLPELAISILAAVRRHADVAIGNVLGSNIFNLLGVLGISALLQPLPVNARILQFDQWVMLGASVFLLLFLYTGSRLSRAEGWILFLGYGAYLVLGFTTFIG